jgi:hypothetical protein
VSVSGNTALIGAMWDDDKGEYSGSAYVFVRAADSTWNQQAKLTASDGAAYDYFGISVAVSGDTAVIGASEDDDKSCNAGVAYVFVRAAADGTWSQQAKLTADDGAAEDWFGGNVSVSGDIAIIGADADDDKGWGSGSAYVFVRAADGTWMQQAKLLAADGVADDRFGTSVAVSGDMVVIGAVGNDDMGSESGSAYVFVRAADGTWTQQTKLLAADGVADDRFGTSVAVSGDTAVIGASLDDDKGLYSGSAYVFGSAPPVTSPHINMAPTYKLLLSGAKLGNMGNGIVRFRCTQADLHCYVSVQAGWGNWYEQARTDSMSRLGRMVCACSGNWYAPTWTHCMSTGKGIIRFGCTQADLHCSNDTLPRSRYPGKEG